MEVNRRLMAVEGVLAGVRRRGAVWGERLFCALPARFARRLPFFRLLLGFFSQGEGKKSQTDSLALFFGA